MVLSRVCSLVILGCAATATHASDFFQVRNEAQFARAVPLPVLAPGAPEAGQLDFAARLELTSEFANLATNNEQLLADGEVNKLTLSASGRYSENSHWSVRLPVLNQGGGFMDDIITDWHDFFGLPQGGRDAAPSDRYRFAYERDGELVLDVTETGTRLGDIEIAWHYEPTAGWLLGAQLQLPTGDEDQLAGGGAWGGSVWVTRQGQIGRFGGFVSAGASANERGDILPEQQHRVTPFGGAGLSVRLFPWATAVTQIYAHRALFKDTEIESLGRDSVQLSVGAVFRPTDSTRLHLLFQEDLAVYASPDFSMQAALYW